MSDTQTTPSRAELIAKVNRLREILARIADIECEAVRWEDASEPCGRCAPCLAAIDAATLADGGTDQ